jgi:hypothetical protein
VPEKDGPRPRWWLNLLDDGTASFTGLLTGGSGMLTIYSLHIYNFSFFHFSLTHPASQLDLYSSGRHLAGFTASDCSSEYPHISKISSADLQDISSSHYSMAQPYNQHFGRSGLFKGLEFFIHKSKNKDAKREAKELRELLFVRTSDA